MVPLCKIHLMWSGIIMIIICEQNVQRCLSFFCIIDRNLQIINVYTHDHDDTWTMTNRTCK